MRILIIEDDPSMASSLKRGLTAEGYQVDVEFDGLAGLDAALAVQYDAIVLDLMLPQKNGYVVVADLRASGSSVPVLMLTAKDGEWDQSEALDAGADDYVTKPFSYPVLLARLRALLRRSSVHTSSVLTIGSLRIDAAAHRCSRGDTEISLTPKEFELAYFLAMHADTAVTKIALLDAVWGADFSDDTNVVEVYVGYLRKKIDTPFGTASVETVRGVGYRLVASG